MYCFVSLEVNNFMNEYNNNPSGQVPYMGGEPVRCPRCSNVVTSRICTFCGLDLSAIYKTDAPQIQQQMPQQPYQNNIPYGNNNYTANNGYAPNNANNNGYNYQYNPNIQNNMQNPYNQNQMQQPINPYATPPRQQPYMYYPPVKNKANKTAAIICAVASVIILLTLIGSLVVNSFSRIGDIYRPGFDNGFSLPEEQENLTIYKGVSQSEFSKLKIGMSYAQVSAIIGGDGELYDEGITIEKEKYQVYAWLGENNTNAAVFITITSDKVSDITLEGKL